MVTQLRRIRRLLLGQQHVVELPELALRRGRLSCFGGELRTGMNIVEREVAPHVTEVVAERGEQLAHDRLRLPAVRALEVAVLDQSDERVVRSADMVASRIHVVGKVENVRGGADDLTSANLPW